MNDKQQLQMLGEDMQQRLQECAQGAAKMQEQRDHLATECARMSLSIDQLNLLKSACVAMGISTPESMEDLGWNQRSYIMKVIYGAHEVWGLAHSYYTERQQMAAQLAEAKAEARKYKLAGLGMAVSMGEHVYVQEGWQVVPVVPTPEMLEALNRLELGEGTITMEGYAAACWKSFLTAAPKPEGGQQ